MSTLGKIVYLSEAQASELFANGSITVDETTITYSANDLYLTPENAEYVNKSGDTMTGALKAKGLRTYVSDTVGNASLNFGETADSTRVGRITMNTTTSRMEFDEENERYFLPAPTASSETSYDIVTTNGSYTLGGQLNTPGINSYSSSWPGFGFALSSDPTTNLASLNYDNTNKCFTFVSPSNDGTDTTESFSLPQETLTDGNWHNYAILTSKTPVTIAQGGTNATTASDALTSLGAVAKSGDTMTGALNFVSNGGFGVDIKTTANGHRGLSMRFVENDNTERTYFYQFKSDNVHYDLFKMPSTDITETSNGTYDILSTKSLVTVAQGGTGATTAANALTNLGAVNKAGDTMTGDLTIKGGSWPTYGFKRSDGTNLGALWASANSGRLILRTWDSTGTYYVDYNLPDDSNNNANQARYFLTTKDFNYRSANQSSGTLAGFVGSDAGVWIVSVYDSADAAKYWIGTISKKSGANPVVTTIANATIGAPWGNTIGTIVFSGATGNYVAQGIKIV